MRSLREIFIAIKGLRTDDLHVFGASDDETGSAVIGISPTAGAIEKGITPATGDLIGEIEAAADSQGLEQVGGWRKSPRSSNLALADSQLRTKKPQ